MGEKAAPVKLMYLDFVFQEIILHIKARQTVGDLKS